MSAISKSAPRKSVLPEGMSNNDLMRVVVDFYLLALEHEDAPWSAKVGAAKQLQQLASEHDHSQMNVDQLKLVQNTLNVMAGDKRPPLKGELPHECDKD